MRVCKGQNDDRVIFIGISNYKLFFNMRTMHFPKRNRIALEEIISIIPSKLRSTWKTVIVFAGYNHERNSQSRERISKVLLVCIFYIHRL